MAIPARALGRQVNLVQALSLLLAFLLVAGVGGVLSAGLVMPAVAGVSVLANGSTTVFSDLPAVLDEQPLSQKSTMYANDGTTVLATFYSENRINVPLDKIAPIMQRAMVAIEDKRFFEHGGIDPQGMARAAARNSLVNDNQGASTLTQQYVKNVLVEAAAGMDDNTPRLAAIKAAAKEAATAPTLSRKLHEAKLAIALEKKYTKDEILGRYLNIAPFGPSAYGVEAAAQYYFSKKAADLNYLEAATLAAMPQNPSKWDPQANPKGTTQRRDLVLRNMKSQKFITPAEYTAGIATPVADAANGGYLKIQDTGLTCTTANAVASSGYFCDYVTKVIAQNAAFGKDKDARNNTLYRGGLTITTTLDPRMQQIADAQVKAAIPVDDPSGVDTAISVVEPGTGRILSMAQNRTYNPYKNPGPRETAVNYNTDSAYGSSKGFSPGSTFKPFTLVEWLKEGHTLNETIDATKMAYPLKEFHTSSCGLNLGRDTWKFGNSEGPGGVMTVQQATQNSVNSGYAKMASMVDFCAIFDGAASLGVHAPSGKPYQMFAPNIIGSDSIAPLTMAAAFAAFAANGMFCDPIAITKVVGANGKELPVPAANCRQAIAPNIAAGVSTALSHVFDPGATGDKLGGLGRPSAGKTGTTSKNEHTWFVGFTPQLATAVWVGHADVWVGHRGVMKPVGRETIGGQYYRSVYGSTIAGPIWKQFMIGASAPMPVLPLTAASSAQIGATAPVAPKPTPAPAAPAKVAPVAPVPPAPVVVPRPGRTPGGGRTRGNGG